MANTANRSYPKTVSTNLISGDQGLLNTALDAIDTDVAALFVALAGKAATSHTHTIANVTGLQSALDAKMNASAAFALDDLSDVSGMAAAPNGYLMLKVSGGWVPATVSASIPDGGLAIAKTSGLQTALDAKAAKANNLSDLPNAATARTNLGLGSIAVKDAAFISQAAYDALDPPDADTIYFITE